MTAPPLINCCCCYCGKTANREADEADEPTSGRCQQADEAGDAEFAEVDEADKPSDADEAKANEANKAADEADAKADLANKADVANLSNANNLRVDETDEAIGINKIIAVNKIVEAKSDRDETNANDSK